MGKRVLMVATVAATIGSFNMENIKILQNMGYSVDVAADFNDLSVWSAERLKAFKIQLHDLNIEAIQLDFSRSPFKIGKHIDSYKNAVKLLEERRYSFIHTHTPIASAIIRLAAHKTNTKVVYTAHGFHFYNGAPLKNWIIFYPVEKFLSKWTEILITINQEDFERAKNHFQAKKTVYVPGVGVDTKKFSNRENGRKAIRKELGIDENRVILLSVGELNQNKNHEAVIKALKGIDITYVIVGKGELKERLKTVAKESGVDLRLMGFRSDVADFYDAADIYILPSIREGLNVSLMEAMASSLPCLCGDIRGNVDLIDENGGYLFDPEKVEDIHNAIGRALDNRKGMGVYNLQKIKAFDLKVVTDLTSKIYGGVWPSN